MTKRQLSGRVVLALIGFLLLIQLVPYGRSHANPPVTRAVRWDRKATESLAASACMDCHSNLTKWRWYSGIAPGSWLIQRDVDGGRNRLNFSEWNKPQPSVDEVVQAIQGGGMPPLQYKLVHAAARLSKSERARLVSGIIATYKKDPPKIQTREHGD